MTTETDWDPDVTMVADHPRVPLGWTAAVDFENGKCQFL